MSARCTASPSCLQCATLPFSGPEQKREATLRAQVALWGGSMTRIDGDAGMPEWVVSRWALTRAFDSLDGVQRFVELVTGRPQDLAA